MRVIILVVQVGAVKIHVAAADAQGSRVIIVVVQVGAVEIHVAAAEALRKTERGDETQLTTNIGGKTSLRTSYFVLLNFKNY